MLVVEILAIIFGLIYTVLYIKGFKECFIFAFVGSGLYAYLCLKKQILAEAFLQLFYVLFAIYGWLNWGKELNTTYSFLQQIWFLVSTVFITLIVGYLLKSRTKSRLPYLDAFTTVFSLTATWLMVNFIHETWLYFIAINLVSVWLYYQRGMKLSVFLYGFYVYLSVAGWFGWELFF